MNTEKSERNPPPLNPAALRAEPTGKTPYPPPWDTNGGDMVWHPVGAMLGLTKFGVNIVTLNPGARSSQRHWHQAQDEFLYMLSGELTLISEAGETPLRPGQCVGFRAGTPDGHCIVNKGAQSGSYLVVGDRGGPERVTYPDIDLILDAAGPKGPQWTYKDGTAYPPEHQPKWGARK